jgi:hypothetical protein
LRSFGGVPLLLNLDFVPRNIMQRIFSSATRRETLGRH